MRIVFGLIAAIIICAGWAVCPVELRDHMARTVIPDAETVEDMRAGTEIIAAALAIRAPDLSDADGESRRQGH